MKIAFNSVHSMRSTWKKRIASQQSKVRKGIENLSYYVLPVCLSLGVTLADPSKFQVYGAIGLGLGEVAAGNGRKTKKFINRLPNRLSPNYRAISFLEYLHEDFGKTEEGPKLPRDYEACDPKVWKVSLVEEIKYYEKLLGSLIELGKSVEVQHLRTANSTFSIIEAQRFFDQFTRTFIQLRVDFIEDRLGGIEDLSLQDSFREIKERLYALEKRFDEIKDILNSAFE